jgi:hypothetical protein
MTRAYLFYFLMAAFLVSGLWLIVTFGNTLAAPDDLSGDWLVQWDDPWSGILQSRRLRIDQSGRFFTLNFENGPKMSLKLQSDWTGARRGQRLYMRLSGNPWTVVCTGTFPLKGPQVPNELTIELKNARGSTLGTATRASATLSATSPPSGIAHAL